MRWWWGLVTALLGGASGCNTLTARQVQGREAVIQEPARPTAPAASPSVEDLALSARKLAESQRRVVESALQAVSASDRFIDCSGFVQSVFAAAGRTVPRTVRELWLAGSPVPAGALRPGDLVFFCFRRHPVDHVGIYAGAGRIVHVSSAAGGVQIASLTDAPFGSAWVGARRLLGDAIPEPGT
jgi:cell wall-associated NlpC family hydrolase